MAFKSGPVAVLTTDTVIFTMPATLAGVVILKLANATAIDRAYTLKFYKQSTGQTTTIVSGNPWVARRIDDIGKFSMEAGDQLIMSADLVSALVAMPLIVQSAATPAAKGFTPKGTYDAAATYAMNDVVRVNADGASYISMVDANIGHTPSSSPTYWMKFLVDGPQGTPGTGNMNSVNNLSDVADVPTAQVNLRLSPIIHRDYGGL